MTLAKGEETVHGAEGESARQPSPVRLPTLTKVPTGQTVSSANSAGTAGDPRASVKLSPFPHGCKPHRKEDQNLNQERAHKTQKGAEAETFAIRIEWGNFSQL